MNRYYIRFFIIDGAIALLAIQNFMLKAWPTWLAVGCGLFIGAICYCFDMVHAFTIWRAGREDGKEAEKMKVQGRLERLLQLEARVSDCVPGCPENPLYDPPEGASGCQATRCYWHGYHDRGFVNETFKRQGE